MRRAAAFRYAFERWLASAYQVPTASDCVRDTRNDGYINPHVNLAWTAWKAGRAYIGPVDDAVPALPSAVGNAPA